MAKFRYVGDNIRSLGPSNASVSKEYKFGPGGVREIAEDDEPLFDRLPEFERLGKKSKRDK